MARPAGKKSDRRTIRIVFRVTPEEAETVKDYALFDRQSFADYGRAMLIAGPMPKISKPYLSQAQESALDRIAVNLAQLIRHIQTEEEHKVILALSKRLNQIIDTKSEPYVSRHFVEDQQHLSRLLFIRVTDDQREVIEARAKEAGLLISEFARKMLLEGRVPVKRYLEIEPALMDSLSQLGRELNALTKQANIQETVPVGVLAVIGEIHHVLDQGFEV